jgi:O-antigen/teichoic acid export membrane protein
MKKNNGLKYNSSLVLFGNLFSQITNFIFVILVGRILGAQIYGEFIFVTSILLIVSIFSRFGFDGGLLYFLSRTDVPVKKKKTYLTFSILFVLLFSFIFVCIGVLLQQPISIYILGDNGLRKLLVYLLPFILFEAIIPLLRNTLRSYHFISKIVVIDNFIQPISRLIIFLIYFFLGSSSINSIIVGYYISYLISIFMYVKYLFNVKELRFSLNGVIHQSPPFIAYSMPLLFSGIIAVLLGEIDKYMIGLLLSTNLVAIYKLAVLFGGVSSIALMSVDRVVAPIYSKLYSESNKMEMQNIYLSSTKWVLIINLLVFGGIILLSEDILRLSGEEFIAGSTALIIIAAGQILNAATGSVGLLNIMRGKSKIDFYANMIALTFNISLNLVLIPNYGIIGAALATAISYSSRNLFHFIHMYRYYKFNPFNVVTSKIFVVFLTSVFIVNILSSSYSVNYIFNILVTGILFTVTYTLGTMMFLLNEEESKQIRQILKKK